MPSLQQPVTGGSVSFERERGVTEVQVTRGLGHVTVHFARESLAEDRLALFQALAAAGVSLFLVKLHPCSVSFAVRANAVDACDALLQDRGEQYTLLRDLGLVATVAGAMRDLSGVMARIYETLVSAGIHVRQTGDAYNAVLLLVSGAETDRAAESLRAAFSLTNAEDAETGPREGVGLEVL